MAFIVNHYELLSVPINATEEEIKSAYEKKLANANAEMTNKYKTAYYVLTDPYRRQQYDLRLGIHRYRNVPRTYKLGKAIARFVLTLLDAFFSFYWCLLFVIVVAASGYYIYLYKTQGTLFVMADFIHHYMDEIIILLGIALIDLLGHFYIRRANRFLKHYEWEYIIGKEDKDK